MMNNKKTLTPQELAAWELALKNQGRAPVMLAMNNQEVQPTPVDPQVEEEEYDDEEPEQVPQIPQALVAPTAEELEAAKKPQVKIPQMNPIFGRDYAAGKYFKASNPPEGGTPFTKEELDSYVKRTQEEASLPQQPTPQPQQPEEQAAKTGDVDFMNALNEYSAKISGNPFSSPEIQSLLEAYTGKKQLSLAPLAALADAWQGGNLANVAVKLDSDKTAKDTILREEARNQRQQKAQDFSLGQSFTKDLQAAIRPYYAIAAAIPQIEDAIAPVQTIDGPRISVNRINSILGMVIKLGGAAGAQTEADVARAWAPFFAKNLADISYKLGGDDYVKPQYAKMLKDFLDSGKKAWAKTIKERADDLGNVYTIKGMSPERVNAEKEATIKSIVSLPVEQQVAPLMAYKGDYGKTPTTTKPTGSPVGTEKPGRGGIKYRKIKEGPDSDRNNWQEVK